MGVCAQKPGHEDAFYNNTCIINKPGADYARFSNGIGGPAMPTMHDNRIYTPDGQSKESGKNISTWQAQGHDLGTTVAKIPSDTELITIAKTILGMA